MDNSFQSLLSTLDFLNTIGAGDPVFSHPKSKYDLDMVKMVGKDKKQDCIGQVNNDKVSYDNIKRISPKLNNTQNYIKEAKILAEQSQSLQDLYSAIKKFDGCALKNTAMNTVFADGQSDADIMLIGEAPGADEDKTGFPFVGLSGQLLDRAFQSIGYSRKTNLYISNVIPWRPPGNRTPTLEEIDICYPFIEQHIYLVKPKICILVGGTAVKAMLKTKDGISKVRGKWIDHEIHDHKFKITAVFHPAYLLRSPGQKKHMWKDLLNIQEYIGKL